MVRGIIVGKFGLFMFFWFGIKNILLRDRDEFMKK